MIGYGPQDAVQSANPQRLVGWNGDSVRRRFLGLHNDVAADLVDFDVPPVTAKRVDENVPAQVGWEFHPTTNISSRTR